MKPLTLERFPPESAPNGVPVLVCGGVAMRKTGDEWFSGLGDVDNIPFSRPLEWRPAWWAYLPNKNESN